MVLSKCHRHLDIASRTRLPHVLFFLFVPEQVFFKYSKAITTTNMCNIGCMCNTTIEMCNTNYTWTTGLDWYGLCILFLWDCYTFQWLQSLLTHCRVLRQRKTICQDPAFWHLQLYRLRQAHQARR